MESSQQPERIDAPEVSWEVVSASKLLYLIGHTLDETIHQQATTSGGFAELVKSPEHKANDFYADNITRASQQIIDYSRAIKEAIDRNAMGKPVPIKIHGDVDILALEELLPKEPPAAPDATSERM